MSEKIEALQSLLKTLVQLQLETHAYGEVAFLNKKIDEIVTSIAKNDQPTAATQNCNGDKQ